MTEPKKPLVAEENKPSEATNTIETVSNKTPEKNKNAPKSIPKVEAKTVTKKPTAPISKLAVLAFIIAIAAPVAHYTWQQQQKVQFAEQLQLSLKQQNNADISRLQKQFQQTLSDQQNHFNQQLQQIKIQTLTANDGKIAQLDQKTTQLEQRIKQRQPSDWLLHESEYLIRIAARTLWLEHDTNAAIGLLKDADARLTELNDPAYLSIRALIHEDIKALEILPKLQTDEIILALMAMNKQVAILPLAVVNLEKSPEQKAGVDLSDNISDWQSNLAKTWQRFLDDFIRVRQRTGSIEPLMAPEQQAHLKQNLSLKVQLALWAASEQKGDIYQKTLTDIEQWLTDFFDMDNDYNQRFAKALATLQEQRVSYHYPNELSSLPAIRAALTKQISELPTPTNKDDIEKTNKNNSGKQTPVDSLDKISTTTNDEEIL